MKDLAKRLNAGMWVAGLALFVLQLCVVLGYSVNLPFWDDWDALWPGHLSRKLSWQWLISFHNTHRNIFTNLSVWMLYRLNDWNVNVQIAANFVLYTLLSVGTIYYLERRFAIHLGALLLFPASAIADEVHDHAFNNCWTFYVLFFFVALALAVRRDKLSWFSTVAAVASAYAAGSGWVCSVAYVTLCFSLAALRPDSWRRHLSQAMVTSVFLVLWFVGYRSQSESLVMPWTRQFWSHFGNLIGLGLGYHAIHALPGLIFFTCVVLLLVFEGRQAIRSKVPKQIEEWLLLATALMGIFMASGAISIARAWAGTEGAKSGRYALGVLFCVPPAWILARQFVNGHLRNPMVRRAAKVVVAFGLLAPLGDEFNYRAVYRTAQERRLEGLRCIRRGLSLGQPAYCPSINPYGPNSASVFEARARELGLSYLREQSPVPVQ